ncbi:N-lysine methyltransferase KMT5A-like, partial [Trichogramma pretiosum]|uniref:N-lysine methyltransferase KMT5A-like n=1 Tax=Trichogramma pretiosum TaxID=7493 RepID=UPI000C71A468
MGKKGSAYFCKTRYHDWQKCVILARDEDLQKLKDIKESYEKIYAEKINKKLKDSSPNYLQIENNSYGRGVYASKNISVDEYVVEYKGNVIKGMQPALKMEKNIDATDDDGSFGRLINHSFDENVYPIVWTSDQNKPHIIFFAKRDIAIGEEIVYNYTEHRKIIWKLYPFLDPNNKNETTKTFQK